MQLSRTTIVTVALALFSTQVAAAPVNVTASESSEITDTVTEATATETVANNEIPTEAVELPFAPESIIETVELGNEVAPIILDDAVYFVNTTVIESEYLQHSEGLQKREAEAWKWHTYLRGQPFKRSVKRSATADAEAHHWKLHMFLPGAVFF